MKNFFISASILSANFSCLGDDIKQVIQAGASSIHFDVMDNHYVPNLTFGPLVCKSLRDYGIKEPIDIHLMAKPIENLIYKFVDAGATSIAIHPESTDNLKDTLKLIQDLGSKTCLAFNPSTSLNYLYNVINMLDVILIMSVNPGFAGQDFIYQSINKIIQVRKIINETNPDILLAVDGGININNISQIANSGANIFVIGSAIFNKINYEFVISEMKKKLYE